MNNMEKWLRLLTIVSQFDAPLNTAGITNSDKETMRAMKRELIKTLLTEKPDYINVRTRYRPEYKSYSDKTKAAANKMMKEDNEHYSYAHYLRQIEPCEDDIVDRSASTVDVIAETNGLRFYFSVPADDIPPEYTIPEKEWEPDRKIYHDRVTRDNEDYFELISSLLFEE